MIKENFRKVTSSVEEVCKNCWNDGCKKASEEFRNNKLPVCKDMIEHPENWNEEDIGERQFDF